MLLMDLASQLRTRESSRPSDDLAQLLTREAVVPALRQGIVKGELTGSTDRTKRRGGGPRGASLSPRALTLPGEDWGDEDLATYLAGRVLTRMRETILDVQPEVATFQLLSMALELTQEWVLPDDEILSQGLVLGTIDEDWQPILPPVLRRIRQRQLLPMIRRRGLRPHDFPSWKQHVGTWSEDVKRELDQDFFCFLVGSIFAKTGNTYMGELANAARKGRSAGLLRTFVGWYCPSKRRQEPILRELVEHN